MKTQILRNLTAVLLMFLLAAGSALAIPSPPSGYDLSTSMNYWQITNLNSDDTNIGTSCFKIRVEEAAYESAFGLYTVNDSSDPDKSSVQTYKVFDKDANPLEEKTLTFRNQNGNWSITDSYDETMTESTVWQAFSSTFGFYYGVDAGDNDDADVFDYTFFTDSRLNSADKGVDHVYTAYNSSDKTARVYLEDLLARNADWDWEDMTVQVNNVSPQPVPEPATMLMFGIGLVGFAFITRRSLGFNKQ